MGIKSGDGPKICPETRTMCDTADCYNTGSCAIENSAVAPKASIPMPQSFTEFEIRSDQLREGRDRRDRRLGFVR